MKKVDILHLAYSNLWRRKMRTILTTLGVIIGTTSIVVMLSLGIGLNENQRRSMESWGSLTMLTIYPGMNYDQDGQPIGEMKNLNDEAVAEIQAMDGVVAVSPVYEIYGETRFGRKRGSMQLTGLDPALMEQMEFEVSQGRLLQPGDTRVMVVGAEVINNFWDESEMRRMQRGDYMGPWRAENRDPAEMLDQRLSLEIRNESNGDRRKNYSFQVVGILDDGNRQYSYQAFAPLDEIKRIRSFMTSGSGSGGGRSGTRQVRVVSGGIGRGGVISSRRQPQGIDPDDYSYIMVKTGDVSQTRQLSQTLRDMGYSASSIADALEGIEKTSRTVQAVMGGIGGISLLVAAIGITNTMIMSIYERTKEIGIMKVIGATFSDVYAMFLTEAGLIGLMGGTAGLVFSYLVSYIINSLSRDFMNQGMAPTEEIIGISLIPPWLALFALAFAALIGIVAGLYPARRAVMLKPINAIRNE